MTAREPRITTSRDLPLVAMQASVRNARTWAIDSIEPIELPNSERASSRRKACAYPSFVEPRMPLSLADSIELTRTPFDQLPQTALCQLLGVPYVHVQTESGDDLFLTQWGWPWLESLLPQNWYRDRYYKTSGTRLRFSSGAVYRVPIVGPRSLQVVVKFSRMGQYLDPSCLAEGARSESTAQEPNFSSPFEEVAALEQLRNSAVRPRVLTKRALAVFSPAERFEDWQLGRQLHQFERQARSLLESQAPSAPEKVALDPHRNYVVLFHWMNGVNLEECVEQGRLTLPEAQLINRMVLADLDRKGFEILDHKPNHVIVKFRRTGSLLQRHGRVVYALADFELLKLKAHAAEGATSGPEPLLLNGYGLRESFNDHGPVAT